MPTYDFSRQLDLYKLNYKLNEPNLSDAERKKIENAIYGIKHQARDPGIRHIQKLRDDLQIAIKNGDHQKAEHIAAEAKKIDRNYS